MRWTAAFRPAHSVFQFVKTSRKRRDRTVHRRIAARVGRTAADGCFSPVFPGILNADNGRFVRLMRGLVRPGIRSSAKRVASLSWFCTSNQEGAARTGDPVPAGCTPPIQLTPVLLRSRLAKAFWPSHVGVCPEAHETGEGGVAT
jgi:hypothetical protein